MSISLANAYTNVRTATARDSDLRLTDTMMAAWVDIESKRLWYYLSQEIPELTESTVAATVAAGSSTINMNALTSSSYYRLHLLEKAFSDGVYDEVPSANYAHPARVSGLVFRESIISGAPTITLYPADSAPGTYRVRYTPLVAPGYTTVPVPEGFEDVVIERVAARARIRFKEDPSPHLAQANEFLQQQLDAARDRHGYHPVGGLRVVRGTLRSLR